MGTQSSLSTCWSRFCLPAWSASPAASGLQESPLQHAPTILTAAWCLQDMPGPCLSTLQESGLQPVLTTPTALLQLVPPKATPTLLATPRVFLVPSAPTTPTATRPSATSHRTQAHIIVDQLLSSS